MMQDLLMRLEAAENRLRAVEMEQIFCYAVGYGARLQRDLVTIQRAEDCRPYEFYCVYL
ncbi:MAG: hypothetical protein IJO41_03800 [Oscillospiraceae bacterium]|nr:hypothetical protein [Oscillospiraceae bacterium]